MKFIFLFLSLSLIRPESFDGSRGTGPGPARSSDITFDSLRHWMSGVDGTAKVHSAPTFNKTRDLIVWCSISTQGRGQLWQVRKESTGWTKPALCDLPQDRSYYWPFFAPGTNDLYFSSNLTLGLEQPRKQRVWTTTLGPDGWQERKLVLDSSEPAQYAISLVRSGNMYHTMENGRGNWDIVLRRKTNGTLTGFIPLADINSEGYDDGVYVSPDETFMLFESKRKGSLAGSLDIYLSFHLGGDKWSEPVGLGDEVNTGDNERFASITPDGKHLYFCRFVNGAFELRTVSAKIIKKLKRLQQKSVR